MEQHPHRSTRVTHASLRNSASMEIQGKEVLSQQDALCCSTHPSIRWRHCELYALRATSYRRTYKSQNSFFGSWVMHFVRPISWHWDSYVKFLQGDLRAKVVPKWTTYCISWGVPRRVSQASLQADSALTRHHEKEPQEPRRTSWLQEKGHWEISPDSRASHPLPF